MSPNSERVSKKDRDPNQDWDTDLNPNRAPKKDRDQGPVRDPDWDLIEDKEPMRSIPVVILPHPRALAFMTP